MTSAPASITVNAPPSVSITAPAANAVVTAPATVSVTASVTDTDGTVAQVQFFANGNPIGTAASVPFTISWSNAAAGTYSLTAIATDNAGASTTSAAVSIVLNSPPSVSLTSPTAGASYNTPASVTLTASASDADGSVTQVQFFDGATSVGTVTSAPYTLALSNVTAGVHSYTAVATDNRGATTTSAAVAITVNAPPSVSITTPANNAVITAPATVTVSANVTDTDGTVAQVQFFANGNPIGTATSAPFSISWANVAAGTYSLTAIATDNSGATTTSAAVALIVNAPPSVSLTSPTAGAAYNAPATVTLTASASDADGTVTQVQFFDGATSVGTVTSAPYTLTLGNVTAGVHSYTAVATDNRGATMTSAAVAIAVNAPPGVNITAPANNSVVTAPANVMVTASVSDTDGTVSQVQLFANGNLIGTATSAPFSISWANVAAGSYSLTAIATDNSGASTTSAAVTLIVNAPPTVSLTSPAAGAAYNAPATVTLTAAAADSDGTITQVQFFDGATPVGTVTSAPYTLVLTNVSAGAHSYTAVATDDRGATTTSAAVAIAVNAPPGVSITAPLNNAVVTAPATLTVTASASDADGTITQVQFFANGNPIGTATSSPYSISWANVAAGTYSLTATATDNLGGTTASAAVSIKVNALPSVTLTSPTNGATFTAPGTVSLAATASDTDGTIAKVEFFRGATLIASVTSAPYSYTWTGVEAGSYNLTAVATDNNGATTTSAVSGITVAAAQAQIYFIHPDHLGTPRMVANDSGTAVWKWDQQEAFGNDVPNGDPGSTGAAFEFNLRFPGQYADRESSLNYNYFRDYDSNIGRYTQSDPIGLRSGVNTYLYVGGNPTRFVDRLGLQVFRPSGAGWAAGRIGDDFMSPGPEGRGRYVDDYLPFGYKMALAHDALVDDLRAAGLPDVVVNVPTLPFMYRWAVKDELEEQLLRLLKRIADSLKPKPALMCKPD